MLDSNTLQAFQEAAGFSNVKLDVLIRTVLLTLFFIWTAWCVYGEFYHFQNHGNDINDVSMSILKNLLLCALMVILVFVI